MQVIEFIRQQFMESGHVAYGETLSMGEHMMQAAFIAEQTGCHKELVVAAFLHDFGYLILGLPEESTESGIDGFHEDIGEQCLKGYFPPLITDCIAYMFRPNVTCVRLSHTILTNSAKRPADHLPFRVD